MPVMAASVMELGIGEICLRLLCAMVVGLIIGTEREYTHRPAGMRTHILVALGSCAVMITGQLIFFQYRDFGATPDPARLSAQVITGVGFLGAGTIIVTKRNQIKGLTTAAGLWAAAAVGLALGIGFYEGALTAGLAIYLILTALQRWDDKMHQNAKVIELYIEQAEERNLGSLIRQLRGMDVEIEGLQTENDGAIEDGARALIVTLRLRKKSNHPLLIKDIKKMDGVLYVEEL